MRSRSFEIFIAMAISRRSTATGWRVANMRIANWSISSSSASTASSRSTTWSARSTLPATSASMLSLTWASTKPPISRILRVR